MNTNTTFDRNDRLWDASVVCCSLVLLKKEILSQQIEQRSPYDDIREGSRGFGRTFVLEIPAGVDPW